MISTNAVIDLEVWEGATFYQEFTWEIGTPPVPVYLADMTARLQARDDITDDEPVFDLTIANGGIISPSPTASGKYAIKLKPSDTEGKCPTHEKRVLVYDLFFDHGIDDDTGKQQKGKITIYPAVTRAV